MQISHRSGYIVVPDLFFDYISTAIIELAYVFSEVTGLKIIRYSSFDPRAVRDRDIVISMAIPSKAFEDSKLYKISRASRLVLWMDDLGWKSEERREEIERLLTRSSLIITPNRTKFSLLWKAYEENAVWLPYFAPNDFLARTIHAYPINKCLLSGNTRSQYPIRHLLHNSKDNLSSILHVVSHPGYGQIRDERYTKKRFADLIRSYFCCVTDSPRAFIDLKGKAVFDDTGKAKTTGQVVKKYFEIPATGSLLIADNATEDEMVDLGFIPYENFIPVTEHNVVETIESCLATPQRFDRIRIKGMKLIRNRHTINHRKEEFARIWKKFIEI